ncbi:uncharacterized protein LOC142977740 [Anticarsia gemmatalis]|uniref:uncharacterized protein LOC142977740 n=1 Tax=Anticarsia gemmatalis TaxID=129554 RepID=UPI003F767344
MDLLNQDEILLIAKQCGFSNVVKWTYEEFEDKTLGYLGDHLNLIIHVESNGINSELRLFVKCMPRFDHWKAEYLKELNFFKKEYIMLNALFNEFGASEGSPKWRPNLLFIKEDIFVFENVILQGYTIPHHQETLSFEELKATVATLARFHAQSYIYEERRSNELRRPFRIWEHYSDYLQEPSAGADWRNVGKDAVIEYLKVFSKHKSRPNFNKHLEIVIPTLYEKAMELMKPSPVYRNVVVHRDLWSNNIFLKKLASTSYHAMFVDYQTVLYCSPMLDLSSLIYFNTSRTSRHIWTNELISYYYAVLSEELKRSGVKVEDIIDKCSILKAYEESIVFGITQASLIIPIVAMSKEKREEIFYNPDSSKRANVVSRSKEFIEYAREDDKYRIRVTELFDEIVGRFILPKDNGVNI